jgi:hypothetical protein
VTGFRAKSADENILIYERESFEDKHREKLNNNP